jgi:hypothetical protein
MEPISFSPVSHHVLDSQIVETASFSGPKSHFMETASFSGPTPKIVEAIGFSDHTPSFVPPIYIEGENSLHLPENSGECQIPGFAPLTPENGISDIFNPPKSPYFYPIWLWKKWP